MMKVAIMGAGFVGESLARALIKAGHEVMLSSRTPESDKMKALIADLGDHARAGTVQETLQFSNVVAVALSFDAVDDVAKKAGDWTDKIVLDMTQVDAEHMVEITNPRVVKIFNSIGAEHYQDPIFNGQQATMLYCGNDEEAKKVAGQLATELGFEAIDAGGLSMAQHVVNLAFLWVNLMRRGMGRDFAFKVIRK